MNATTRLVLVTGIALGLTTAACAQVTSYRAVRQPTADPALAVLPAGVMLTLPGIFADFVIGGGGQFVELADGTARLTGRVFSSNSLYSAFLVDIVFSGRIAPGNPAYPPPASPDLQLQPSAYTPAGPIDAGAFVYYTAANGTLTGSSNYGGAVLDLTLTGGAVQLGLGANNRNGLLGLQGAFQVVTTRQPMIPFGAIGTAELAIDLITEHTDKVTHPEVDSSLSLLTAGRAMRIPWIADDYKFVPAGTFTEHDDGTATLAGRLLRLDQLDDAWDLTLQLGARLDPGEASYPPAGSPVELMQASAYVSGGGTIDPDHWHYYQTATGTLTGLGYNHGGVIALVNSGAVQYGGGANQTNAFYGYFGSLQPTVTAHPTGRTLVIGGDIALYGLCQIFPELPLPVIHAPAVPYTLPTLTDQPIVLSGDNLAWAELVGVGAALMGPGDKSNWFSGWFEIIDNHGIELYPRPGLLPGQVDLSVFTGSWRSNVLPITLVAPTSPALFSERTVGTGQVLHVLMHQGSITGPAMSAVAMSGSLLPTTFPGAAVLDIGNGGLELTIVPATFLHDGQTGVARWDFGPMPPWYTGFVTHFQAVTVDLSNPTLPLPSTNVWSVTF